MIDVVLLIGGYILYAFTQASIMMRFGIGPKDINDPAGDLLAYMLLAPVFTLIGIAYFPAKAFVLYANHLRNS